jgi:hypothetical protein
VTSLLLSFVELFSQGHSPELTKTEVLTKTISMLLPGKFAHMSPDALELKYPTAGHRPTEVYTNKEGTINIALNHTSNKAMPKDLPAVRQAMEAQFNKAPFEFIKGEQKDLNGNQFVILEFVSTAVDTKIYNLMAMGSLEGRLLIVTFNCTVREQKEWAPVGRQIINSITFKK